MRLGLRCARSHGEEPHGETGSSASGGAWVGAYLPRYRKDGVQLDVKRNKEPKL